jgi:hypothetical protein
MKIKIIDFLNKIANHEQLPKKIKYRDEIYTLYNEESFINYEPECGDWLFNQYLYKLNEEIEIIEEKKIELPEKIKIEQDTPSSNYYIRNEFGTKCGLTKHSKMIAEKLNETLGYLKYKEDKEVKE